ncbi:MAG TPA: tetratricopeptide repeat protein [Rhodocyclaceae bacterium]
MGYKILISGTQPSHTEEQVAAALSPHLRRPAEDLLSALRSRQIITLTLRGAPLAVARTFKETLDRTGCACELDSTEPLPAEGVVLPGDFGGLKLRPFANPAVGLVLNAPRDWRDGSDERFFRITHAGVGSVFTSSFNPSPGVQLAVWAEIRFGAMAEKMDCLKPHRAPWRLETAAGTGIVGEFRGLVPGDAKPTHQMVLCLRPPAGVASLNITASVEDFERHRALYEWLLRTQLRLLDPAEAAAMAHDDPEEQFDIAVRHAGADKPQEAVAWFRRAAEQGHADAQFALGHFYARGEGVARDDAQAFAWWRKAAEQGIAGAQYNLASMYAEGLGTAPDPVLSFRWRLKAAEQGMAQAQLAVADAYLNGKGVEPDQERAVGWYCKASSQANETARQRLKALGLG